MDISKLLAEFGLLYKEDDVYLACLELGLANVNEISIKANIKRTTAYDVLAGLIKKGLIGQTIKGKKRLFYAENPEKISQMLDEKQKKFAEILPILKSLHNTAGEKPKIRYYENKEGLKDVYRDTLNFEGELSAFVTENIIEKLGREFADEYTEKKARITVKAIGPNTAELLDYQKNDEKDRKETRLVLKNKFPFSIEMNIYGNKIAFMSFKEEMGIIIESSEIAKNMRLLFELAWEGTGSKKDEPR